MRPLHQSCRTTYRLSCSRREYAAFVRVGIVFELMHCVAFLPVVLLVASRMHLQRGPVTG